MILSLVLSRSSFDRVISERAMGLPTMTSPLTKWKRVDARVGDLSPNTGSCFEAYDTLIIEGSHQAVKDHVFHFWWENTDSPVCNVSKGTFLMSGKDLHD